MNYIEIARNEMIDLSNENALTTGKVRALSLKLFKTLDDKNIDYVLKRCEEFLLERDWALGLIAYDWAFRVKKQYSKETFTIFERWLKEYVTGWGDCDDFCTHAFGELLGQYNEFFPKVLKWTEHPDFFVRRAAAVILIYPMKKNRGQEISPLLISDALMNDSHHLVLKGYGWMLKVLSEKDPLTVYNYLLKYKSTMPRISYRYALEKLDEKMRSQLMEG